MQSDKPDNLRRLIGEAVALEAESVSPVSQAEVDLLASTNPIAPTRSRLSELRGLIGEGFDPLGADFCEIYSPVERRSSGATYTPPQIVDAMVAWALDGPRPDRIIDPGSGSARFALSAGRVIPQATVEAVELDPVAALISRANLAAAGLGSRARVHLSDYRSYRAPEIEGRSLYIGNPPYVRHHNIDAKWKRWLTATGREQGLSVSQLSGLHLYFVLATAIGARLGDRGVFITSSEWLDVNYGSLMRELVLGQLGGEAIHVIAPEAEPFEDAQTTGAITCFEIGARPSSIRLRRVKKVSDLSGLKGGQRVSRERLAEAKRWSPLLRTARKIPEGYIELGEICRVHRGTATGANRVWVIDPENVDLPQGVLFHSVTRARELFAAGDELASPDRLRAVVNLPTDLDVLTAEERRPVERFIRKAKRQGVDQGYIASHRPAWWSVGLREPAPILATYMARRPPAIVRNLAGARHINIAHGFYPRQPLSEFVLERLASAVRSSIHIGQGRTYAGGLTKFEPREFERILIPNVAKAES
ncbi:MAG: Eco57I restriction-modification methylase domain-containing protein [Solirubrobacterales bacterium]